MREIDTLWRCRDLLLALFLGARSACFFGAGFTGFVAAYPRQPFGENIVDGAVLKLKAAILDLDCLVFVEGEVLGNLPRQLVHALIEGGETSDDLPGHAAQCLLSPFLGGQVAGVDRGHLTGGRCLSPVLCDVG